MQHDINFVELRGRYITSRTTEQDYNAGATEAGSVMCTLYCGPAPSSYSL